MYSQGKFWNYLIRERDRERIVIVGLGNIELLYKELEKEQNYEIR